MNESHETETSPTNLHLIEEDKRLYREIHNDGVDLPVDDPRLDNLRRLGVVFTEPLTNQPSTRPLPHTERAFYQREIAQIARHLERITEIAPILDALAQAADCPDAGASAAVEVLRAKRAINAVIFEAIDNSSIVWSSQTKPRPVSGMQTSLTRDLPLLSNGARFRNLYPTSARTRSTETEYARLTAETGNAESRTSSRRFARMILTDKVGVISDIRVGEGVAEPAIIIRDPALLAWLVEMFEREWEAADPWFPDIHATSSARELIERDILLLLSEGHSRDAICRKLEISVRTYSKYLVALRDRYLAKTNEQLMFEWGKRQPPR